MKDKIAIIGTDIAAKSTELMNKHLAQLDKIQVETDQLGEAILITASAMKRAGDTIFSFGSGNPRKRLTPKQRKKRISKRRSQKMARRKQCKK